MFTGKRQLLDSSLDSVQSRLTYDEDIEPESDADSSLNVTPPVLVNYNTTTDDEWPADDLFYDSVCDLNDLEEEAPVADESPKKGDITLLCDDLSEFHVITPERPRTPMKAKANDRKFSAGQFFFCEEVFQL